MNRDEAIIFKHHDRINSSPPGTVLLVCEPCQAIDMEKGGFVDLVPGQHLRVRVSAGGLSCDVAMSGRVKHVSLHGQWFHCVDRV